MCSLRVIVVRLWKIFFFQAEDGIRDGHVTGVQTCALPICRHVVESWQVPGRFWDQSWSYRTTVEEISLLPRWGLLDASHEGLREIDPEPLRNHEDYDAYLSGLEEYRSEERRVGEEWTSRRPTSQAKARRST